MNYELPSKKSWTVYTKTNCNYCIKSKFLLSNKNPPTNFINCDEYLQNDKDSFLSFIQNLIGKEYKKFPMIFYNGKFIGGFTEAFDFCYNEQD